MTSLNAISLFTGVGGLDFGLEAAGFQISVAVESDASCCRTLALNRSFKVICDDIHRVASATILANAHATNDRPALLVGGPPCQPFSKSGYWATGDARRLHDPRSSTLGEFLRVLRDAQPHAFLLENVPGLSFSGKDDGFQHLLTGIERINNETGSRYRVSWKVLNAADYGVPQTRERLFLIGARNGAIFEFPEATHFALEQPTIDRIRHTNAWDAIGDLPTNGDGEDLAIRGKWAELLPTIPEGQNYLYHTSRGDGVPLFGWRTRYWSFLLKLAKNRPSWTIVAQPGPAIGPFHWKNRRLSTRELCRLQTFPDNILFNSNFHEIQRQIGNAVPSLLAEILGREIRTQFFGEKRLSGQPKLMPKVNTELPPPEYPSTLPIQYAELAGNHPDHPGHGLGRGALARKSKQNSHP